MEKAQDPLDAFEKQGIQIDYTLPGKYLTGISRFDDQHHGIFLRLTLLSDSYAKGRTDENYNSHVRFLLIYTKTHLVDEEDTMRMFNYPLYEVHKQEHDAFRKQSERFMQAFDDGSFSPLALLNFIREWFDKHIQKSDRQYSEFFKSQLDK